MGLFLSGDDGFDPKAAVIGLANGLARTARIARALVENDRTVELAGLDNGAGLLCAKALDLPPDQGRTVRANLLELRAEVDALTAALRDRAPD